MRLTTSSHLALLSGRACTTRAPCTASSEDHEDTRPRSVVGVHLVCNARYLHVDVVGTQQVSQSLLVGKLRDARHESTQSHHAQAEVLEPQVKRLSGHGRSALLCPFEVGRKRARHRRKRPATPPVRKVRVARHGDESGQAIARSNAKASTKVRRGRATGALGPRRFVQSDPLLVPVVEVQLAQERLQAGNLLLRVGSGVGSFLRPRRGFPGVPHGVVADLKPPEKRSDVHALRLGKLLRHHLPSLAHRAGARNSAPRHEAVHAAARPAPAVEPERSVVRPGIAAAEVDVGDVHALEGARGNGVEVDAIHANGRVRVLLVLLHLGGRIRLRVLQMLLPRMPAPAVEQQRLRQEASQDEPQPDELQERVPVLGCEEDGKLQKPRGALGVKQLAERVEVEPRPLGPHFAALRHLLERSAEDRRLGRHSVRGTQRDERRPQPPGAPVHLEGRLRLQRRLPDVPTAELQHHGLQEDLPLGHGFLPRGAEDLPRGLQVADEFLDPRHLQPRHVPCLGRDLSHAPLH
mmetsp:Transcript_7956/g.29771  ORF Transcript_7956/g.29771 Transcript_7956/m.29771 type:complete len:521 (-) Transcript_7956:76-1638(-)